MLWRQVKVKTRKQSTWSDSWKKKKQSQASSCEGAKTAKAKYLKKKHEIGLLRRTLYLSPFYRHVQREKRKGWQRGAYSTYWYTEKRESKKNKNKKRKRKKLGNRVKGVHPHTYTLCACHTSWCITREGHLSFWWCFCFMKKKKCEKRKYLDSMIRLKTKKAAKEQHVSWLVVRFSFLSASHGQLLAMIWGAKKGGTQI